MAYELKKDHVTNWDMQESNDKLPYNDDQDTYISERSSTASSREQRASITSPKIKRSPTPPPPPQKDPHPLRYVYNALPENGIPLATQVNQAKKEEKKRQKNIRKAPPGQGKLAPLPETDQTVVPENYYPYWRNFQEKNPDYLMRHRQTTDGQLIPYEHFDPSQYVHEPGVTKTRRHHRKSRRRYDSQHYPDKIIEKISPTEQYVSLKDPDSNENFDQSSKRTRSRQRHNDDQRKISQSSGNNSTDEHKKHRHHHHHRHSIPQSQQQQPPPPSQDHHHHHHHRHHHKHHRNNSAFKEFVDTEFKVIDASFKKPERSLYFQEKQTPTNPSPPAIYNQDSFLPPITRNYYYRPSLNDYYGTQTFQRDWIKSPKIYKANPQTNFYDRYLNNIIDKRLAT